MCFNHGKSPSNQHITAFGRIWLTFSKHQRSKSKFSFLGRIGWIILDLLLGCTVPPSPQKNHVQCSARPNLGFIPNVCLFWNRWENAFFSTQSFLAIRWGCMYGSRAPGRLFDIGDEKQPNYIGVIISHIRIPINQPVLMEGNKGFFALLLSFFFLNFGSPSFC